MKYATIVADPPWPMPTSGKWTGQGGNWAAYNGGLTELPYDTLTVDQIADLPVAELIATEGYVFLWTTNRFIEEAFRVVRAWTLRPRQVLVWCKPPMGQGMGGMFTTNVEFVVVAQRIGKSNAHGKRTNGLRIDTSWFQWPRAGHSQKPEAFLDLVEQVSPGPYLELFARRQRLGWDTWGNEALEHVEIG